NMTAIDRRKTRREQRDKGRLWPLQVKDRLAIAVGADMIEVAIPGLARIATKLLGRLALQQIPGALDVGGRKRLPIMPFDPLAQLEIQLDAVLARRPALGEVRDGRLHAVLRLILPEHDELVH